MYEFRLYVVGQTPKSVRIAEELARLLDDVLDGHYSLKVIDVVKNPQLAEDDKILATPALARVLPAPVRKIIGDLSDKEQVLLGLDLTTK